MIKGLIIIAMFISSSGIGYLKYLNLKEREDLLWTFRELIYSISTEINYFREPLEILFKKLGYPLANSIITFMNDGNCNFKKAYKLAVKMNYENSCLGNEDIKIIEKLGDFLGQSDWENQSMQLELLEENISLQLKEARLDVKEKGKMYKKIGLYFGIVIGILFI